MLIPGFIMYFLSGIPSFLIFSVLYAVLFIFVGVCCHFFANRHTINSVKYLKAIIFLFMICSVGFLIGGIILTSLKDYLWGIGYILNPILGLSYSYRAFKASTMLK